MSPLPSTEHPAALALALEETIAAADRLLAESGLPRHRHLLRVLRGERVGGRRPEPDAAMLEDARRMIAAGLGRWTACQIAGRKSGGSAKFASVARRLLRKL